MGSILQPDRIGNLTQGGSNVSLGPSVLTIGGRQFVTTSTISATLPALSAHTRYQIFAVVNAGTVELRISTDENSVGPSGFLAWKLVGAFYVDDQATPVFSQFMNIAGSPPSVRDVLWDADFAGMDSVISVTASYSIDSNGIFKGSATVAPGTPNSDGAAIILPSGFLITTASSNGPIGRTAGQWGRNQSSGSASGMSTVTAGNRDRVFFAGASAVGGENDIQVFPGTSAYITANRQHLNDFEVSLEGWPTRPIEDL